MNNSSHQEYKRTLNDFYSQRWKVRGFDLDNSPSRRRRVRIITEALRKYILQSSRTRFLRVLDYGCGSGWLLGCLSNYPFHELHAYDVTPSPLKNVKAKYPNVHIHYGEPEFPSPLPSNYFHVITSIEVVEHVPREQKARYFEDLHRIAQPGGLIVLTTPNGRWRGSALPISAEQPVEDWILQTELEMLAKEAGMKILEIGTRGIYRYSSLDRYILTYRLKTILQHFRLWDRYQELLESLGRGITLYAILDVKKE